ncbi:helix-turn-helix transcriptional regulator [Nonomuraea sp. MG754425]|uniref:helix-turn-helix transcriptional regulator n=1 Tax=Nonomuraea sp. MG754425 TaxID=2570319 RepID=UPI001F2B8405|nr:helix-turn-helix transcriptional regulator [Nonomuraea sp. MG754425]MCF6471416.1 helix-turn-helix transcriptional regulator [Nonomuraea sp. MG754425]
MFVGRTAEVAALRAELRAAGAGAVRTAAVEGPEGIGKTALVRHALGGEAGVRVLAVSGEENERELPLGVAGQLMDETAPDPWTDGPRNVAQDPCAAGRELCERIGRAGRSPGTLAVVVDDAQWADRASLQALGYALRHVRACRVLVVLACRDLADPWLPEGLRRLLTGDGRLLVTLGGLRAADLRDLAAATPGRAPAQVLGPAAAERLRAHTLGNPLHARALLAVLPPRALDDPATRLPAPVAYRRSFARRLDACAPAARRLVAACAVLGGGCPLHVAAAVATGIGEPLHTLEEAVAAGLLRELPGRLIDFPEPLAGAAAYDGIGAGTRARLHLAAARLADDDGTALRHRAAAADGPDDVLAEELARFAVKAAQHGLWQEAAAHLDLAAGLTESPARRDELRTAALEHVLVGGDVIRAAGLAAVPNADPRPVRRYVLGRLALAAGRFEEASELLGEAWRHAEPGFAADVAEQLSWLHLVTGNRAEAADWARLAIEQPIRGPVARPYDVLALGGAPGAGAPPDSLAEAVACLARDEAGRARAVLRRVVTAAGAAGLPHHRLAATALLAVAEHGLARWDEAAEHAEAALAEAAELGQRWLLPCLEAACVAPLAARGEHERALAHATAAAGAARAMRHTMGERQADLAMALLGAAGVPACGGWDAFVPDPRPARVEALVADGRLEEAERVLAAHDQDGPPPTGVRRQAERSRLEGLLLAARNVPTRAEEAFGRALELAGQGACPLEEARALLDLGRLLRRTGRRKAAAERLGAARAIFERLGARPAAERCAHELEACGLEPPATVRLGLTPQELSTATLVAGGLTNRQIARELLISVKTVEYHLGKIYTKLGIGSRVVLAARLAAYGDPEVSSPGSRTG